MRALVVDLETTSVDIHSTGVVSCAVLETELPGCRPGGIHEGRFRPPNPIPAEATEVHGITDEMVQDSPPFASQARAVHDMFDGVTVLTFNGTAFDLPIMRRVLRIKLANPHVDVYRVWMHARRERLESPHGGPAAHRYTGALGSMHAFLTGLEPSGEHDAGCDVRMTLDGARYLIGVYGLESCLAWTSGPLPGDVDFEGKLKRKGDHIVFTFGKHKGATLRAVCLSDRHYLGWILRADFHDDTKRIIRRALDSTWT